MLPFHRQGRTTYHTPAEDSDRELPGSTCLSHVRLPGDRAEEGLP